MKRTAFLTALLAALAAGCQTRPPVNPFAGPTETLMPDGSRTSYAGRTSAASGQLSDTSEAAIIAALAGKLEGREFTYASAVRSAVTQPDVDTDSKIETAHKSALEKAGKALSAGATGDYSAALSEAASLAGQLIAARTARANGPKADTGAISNRILSSGAGHAMAATVGIRTFGETIQSAKRGSYSASLNNSTTDTTATADWEALGRIFESLKKPIVPPAVAPVAPPIIFPPIDPAPVSTNTVETITLPGLPQ